jgi:hypothetical protein
MTTPLPTLDQVLADPGCVAGLSDASLKQLLLQIAAAQTTVTARLVSAAAAENGNGASPVGADEMLTVGEVAKILRREPRWIWRNKSCLPFLRRVGNKRALLASRHALDRWIASQRIR